MSAPWEVWIKSYPPCDQALGATYRKRSDEEYDTRFLNANLTCGECGAIACMWRRADHAPACMAIVPRKVTP